MIKRYSLPVAGILLIATLASLLYMPFLGNALVFDDHNFFSNHSIYDFAIKPFALRPRHFPSFTLGFVQVMGGSIETHRIVSLVLHVLCAWMLFCLLSTLLKQALKASTPPPKADETPETRKATVLAVIGASWFAIHPIAVYGAGYLAQRTILFATLFSLMSLWFYRRAFAENRIADVITAALFYSAAVFSKEHAVMLPLAAVALTVMYDGNWRTKIKRAGLYLVLCIPAAMAAITANKGVVATSYEPYVGEITSQISGIPLMDKPWGQWVVSVAIQAKVFFDYVYYWLVPDVRALSADMRLDFVQTWNSGWVCLKVALYAGWGGGALYLLLRRRGAAALFGAGMLYFWLLYAPEFATVRFQEPFVLYRSYLWAPGLAMMLAALLSRVPLRASLLGFAVMVPLLIFLGRDRLQSFSTEKALWDDAAAKLTAPDLPGADRIYYNRGGERFKKKELAPALDDLNKVVTLNPKAFQGYMGRGAIYMQMKKYPEALAELDKSLSLHPPRNGLYGLVQYHRGIALTQLGRPKEALEAYRASADDGYYFAKLMLEQSGQGNRQ